MRSCTSLLAALTVGVAVSVAQSPEPLIKKVTPEKGYFFRNAAAKVVAWSDKGYIVSAVPPTLKGAVMLVRPSGAARDWPHPSEYVASADCMVFLAVRSEFNGKADFPEDRAKALLDGGWTEVEEVFRVAPPRGESWNWRLFKREIAKGKVDVRLMDVKLDAMTVFLFAKKPKSE